MRDDSERPTEFDPAQPAMKLISRFIEFDASSGHADAVAFILAAGGAVAGERTHANARMTRITLPDGVTVHLRSMSNKWDQFDVVMRMREDTETLDGEKIERECADYVAALDQLADEISGFFGAPAGLDETWLQDQGAVAGVAWPAGSNVIACQVQFADRGTPICLVVTLMPASRAKMSY